MEDNTVIHRNEEAEDDSYYAIKAIHWGGGPCAVLCQNTNGPCPLLAICNVLLLRKDISIHPDQGEVSLRQISQILAEYALQRTPPGASGSNQLDTLLNLIPRLQYGLDVNVRFDNVQGFEFTEEMTAFDATGVTLRHGWLLDPQDEHTHAAINGKSYNQLVERLVEYKSKALEDTMKKDASDLQVPAHEVEGATPNLPSAAEETKETQLGSDILSREESPQPQSEEVPVALTQSDDLLVVTETLLDSKPKVEIGIMDAGPVMAASGTKPEITEGGGEPVGADLKLVEEVTPPHLTEAEAVAEITLEPLENRVDDAASGTKAKIADGGGEPVTDVFRLVEDVTPSHLAVAETAPEDVTPSHPAVAETAPELLPLDGEGDRPSGVDVTCTDTDAPEEEMPAAQEKHAVDDQHWDSSLLQTATGEPDDREGLIIESFLSGTSSQLTYYGLHKLHEDVAEGELCVFFRNNHFATLVKVDGQLHLLLTDYGYAREPGVVWERLSEIDGDTELLDSDFRPIVTSSVGGTEHLPAQLPLDSDDPDLLLAFELQREAELAAEHQLQGGNLLQSSDEPWGTGPSTDEQLARALQEEYRLEAEARDMRGSRAATSQVSSQRARHVRERSKGPSCVCQ